MSAQQIIQPQLYVGVEYAGYKLFIYDVGTTTKQTIWTDSTQGTTQSNPATIDANGFINVFVNGNFKAVLAASEVAGAPSGTVWTQDECLQDPDGISIASQTAVTVASGDLILLEDISNSNAKGRTTAQAIADLKDADVVNDTTPQLGGDLDANAFDIQFDDATGIRDDSDNEQLIFQKTASAVNHIEVTNAATANAPQVSAAGDDTNIDLQLAAKGTGDVAITGASIKLDDAEAIKDSNGNEQLVFQETASAVNQLEITNAATGTNPQLAATGDDANIGLDIALKGTGAVTIDGTAATAAEVRLAEDTDNGTNYMGIKAPAAITTSTTLILPDGDGTADQYLKTNGSGTLSWTDAASGAWTYIGSSGSLASVSSVDFEDGVSSITLDGTYDAYKFVLSGITANSALDIYIRLKQNGTWNTSSWVRDATMHDEGGTKTNAGSGNGSEVHATVDTLTTSLFGALYGEVNLANVDNTTVGKRVWGFTHYATAAAQSGSVKFSGVWNSGNSHAVTGIRFYTSTSTFANGNIHMFGLTAS